MVVAKLPEPTPVLRQALARSDAAAFERALFDWIEKASGVRPCALWLLNDSFDALSRFAAHSLPIPMDEAIGRRFAADSGAWLPCLTGGNDAVFCLPLGDGKRSYGLIDFTVASDGTAWRRTAACLVQVYLAQRHQRQERAALESMLMQVRKTPANRRGARPAISLKTGHLAPLKSQFERTLIADRLDTFGQAKAAAQSLGITYRSLAQKCKQYGLV